MKKYFLSFLLILSVVFSEAQLVDFKELAVVHTTPVKDQARAGSCWSFATISFIETETIRITGEEFDLSDAFPVYYAYINKAKIFVRLNGHNNFGQGGQAHDVIDVVEEYGIVPESVYPYIDDHTQLENDLKSFLDSIVKLDVLPNYWLKDYIKILDEFLGVPPSNFEYNNVQYTPKSFLKEVLEFDVNNYVEITSFAHHNFYEQFVLEVPDNWSLSLYYNVPISEFISIINESLLNDYSVCWDGDVSEDGFKTRKGLANLKNKNGSKLMVMSAQPHRQRLFDLQITTDDHLMHAVGMYQDTTSNTNFYLIKNSWGEYKPYSGYLYMSEDYMKYKTIAILVHKDAIPDKIKDKLKL